MPCDYTTIEMMEAINRAHTCSNFLTRTFFPVSKTHVPEKIQVDVKKGRRRMAPFVSPRRGGKVMTREGYNTNTIWTPKLAPETIMTTDDISKRAAGEGIYSRDTPEKRKNKLLAEDMDMLQESIERRKEWMSRQVLLDGRFDVVDKKAGVDIHVDYGFTNKEVLLENQMWSDEDSDPDALLDKTRRAILKSSGVSPNIILGDSQTIRLYLKNKRVQRNADILNVKDTRIEPHIVDDNIIYYGRIASLGLDIYSYDEWFLNDKGEKEEEMIPYGNIILASDRGIGTMHYGGVTQAEPNEGFVTYEEETVPKHIVDEDNELEKLRMTSRPIPAPDDVDSWAVLVVDKEEGL